MKMFFSANKRGIPPKPISIEKKENQPVQTMNDKQESFNQTAYILKYGMIALIQNAPGCSSCDK